jgi:prepilin-type N-terminal cleavage/methylation domain-containing protein
MNIRRHHMVCSRLISAKDGESGMTLIEILIALGILAAVAVVFLVGMETSSKAVMVSQNRVTVESLAKSEMEYIKSQTYDDKNDPPKYGIDPNLDIPQGYNVSYTAERLDPKGDGTNTDDGIQKITVTVTHVGEPSITVESYKLKT